MNKYWWLKKSSWKTLWELYKNSIPKDEHLRKMWYAGQFTLFVAVPAMQIGQYFEIVWLNYVSMAFLMYLGLSTLLWSRRMFDELESAELAANTARELMRDEKQRGTGS